jgi:hypothetical protein
MNMRMYVLVSFCGLVACQATAQSLTGRSSGVSYAYVYGAGADANSDNDTTTDAALLATDQESIEYAGSTSGVLPGGQPYSAGVDGRAAHEYAVGGPLNAFNSIVASGQSSITTAITGAGLAQMFLSNPGNELLLNFEISAPTDYQLSGTIDLPGASAFSFVALQFFDGIVWQNGIFNSIFLPGGEGDFQKSGTLAPGQYRMYSKLSLDAFGNESVAASYNYRLTIPAPAGILPLFAGVAAIGRRKR